MLASEFTVPPSAASASGNTAALLLQYSLGGRYLVAFKKIEITKFLKQTHLLFKPETE